MPDAWVPHPDTVVTQRATGMGNMGTVTDKNTTARFSLPVKYVLVFMRAKFTGGTGNDTMSLYMDHEDESTLFDFLLEEWSSMGADSTAYKEDVTAATSYPHRVFNPGADLVYTWTNPDSGTMRWSLEVGLAPVPSVVP